jgi:hypothetical protein
VLKITHALSTAATRRRNKAVSGERLLPIGLTDPVTDRLCSRLELTRQIRWVPARTQQINDLATELWCIRGTGFRHDNTFRESEWGCPSNQGNYNFNLLHRHRRLLLLRLEQARGATLDYHVHRTARLGAEFLITKHWYLLADPVTTSADTAAGSKFPPRSRTLPTRLPRPQQRRLLKRV